MSLTKVSYSMIQGAPLNVLDYGADNTGTTDSSSAIQAAINDAAGNWIVAPPGTYRLNTGLVYDTSGDGIVAGLKIVGAGMYKTIFDNRSGGAAITCTSGTSITDFQENVVLNDFQISNSTSVAAQTGIYFTGIIFAQIKGVYVKDQVYGFRAYSSTGDATSNVHIDIDQCNFSGNTNTGIYCQGETAGVNAFINVRQTQVITSQYGIVFESMQNGTIQDCAIAYNTVRGVVLSRNSTNPSSYTKNCVIKNNEFDSNVATQLLIDYAENTEITDNFFIVNTGYAVTNQISVTSNSFYTEIKNSKPRCPAGITGVTMYLVGANAFAVNILQTDWISWSDTGNTRYVNTSSTTNIFDDNKWIRPPANTVIAVSSTPDNYAPDVNTGNIFRLVIDTGSARNIAAPLYPTDGQVITLIIVNGLGGALTLTLAATYKQASFTAPASGKQITAQYCYVALSSAWVIIGNWSSDI